MAGSMPSTRSVPAVTGEMQPIMRIVLVLPAPLGPRKPKASPALHVEVDGVHGREVAEALGQPTGMEERGRRVGGHARDGTADAEPPDPTVVQDPPSGACATLGR